MQDFTKISEIEKKDESSSEDDQSRGGFPAQPPEDADDEITSSFGEVDNDAASGRNHFVNINEASSSSPNESSRRSGNQKATQFEFNYEKSSSIHCDDQSSSKNYGKCANAYGGNSDSKRLVLSNCCRHIPYSENNLYYQQACCQTPKDDTNND